MKSSSTPIRWSHVRLFRELFCGIRNDVYGVLRDDGAWMPVRRPFNNQAIVDHLRGHHMLSSYPLDWEGNTNWIGADFDGKLTDEGLNKAFDESYELANLLSDVGIHPICNLSRSSNGVHIRVVFERPIKAYIARSFMLQAILRCNIKSTMQGGSFDRLFPAQLSLYNNDPNSLGNALALPMNEKVIEQNGGTRLLHFCDDGFMPIERNDDAWHYIQQHKRCSSNDLLDVITHWKAMHHIRPPVFGDYDKEERKFSCQKGDLKREDIDIIAKHCMLFKKATMLPLSYMEWFAIGTVCAQFDSIGGLETFQLLSSYDKTTDSKGFPRYDRDKTAYQYEHLINYKPVRCSSLYRDGFICDYFGQDGQCNLFRSETSGRGPYSPAAIPFFADNLRDLH